jgi:type II secretory pathway pseudopilin PulG
MIVSVAIFSIVATITVGALLILISTNQQLQTEQNIMTNLSFALDSMTREIRTGTNYHCSESNSGGSDNIFEAGTNLDTVTTPSVRNCPNGAEFDQDYQGVSFRESGDSITGTGNERILYFYDRNLGQILRRVGTESPQSIVSSGLFVTDAEFFVTGTNSTDSVQPTVTVVIEARESDDVSNKLYRIQTTVVQRALDI